MEGCLRDLNKTEGRHLSRMDLGHKARETTALGQDKPRAVKHRC